MLPFVFHLFLQQCHFCSVLTVHLLRRLCGSFLLTFQCLCGFLLLAFQCLRGSFLLAFQSLIGKGLPVLHVGSEHLYLG